MTWKSCAPVRPEIRSILDPYCTLYIIAIVAHQFCCVGVRCAKLAYSCYIVSEGMVLVGAKAKYLLTSLVYWVFQRCRFLHSCSITLHVCCVFLGLAAFTCSRFLLELSGVKSGASYIIELAELCAKFGGNFIKDIKGRVNMHPQFCESMPVSAYKEQPQDGSVMRLGEEAIKDGNCALMTQDVSYTIYTKGKQIYLKNILKVPCSQFLHLPRQVLSIAFYRGLSPSCGTVGEV